MILFFCRCRTRLKLWRSSIRFVSIDNSPIWENKWDKYSGVTIKHKQTRQAPTNNPTTKTKKDTQAAKWNTTLSEKSPCLSVLLRNDVAFFLASQSLLRDDVANITHRCSTWPIVINPAFIVQMTQWGIWKKLLPFHCSPVIDPDVDEGVHRVLLSSLFCTIRFYHGLSVWCMPIATTDTSVSVDHQQ